MRVFRPTLRLLLAVLALLPVLPGIVTGARADTRDYYFERIDATRGLAQNTVTALAQDSQGFMWVGTQGGLHRFDGQRYRLFRHDPRDPSGMPESYVTALAVEGSRALWVGTYSQHVARLDLATGRIRRFPVTGDPITTPRRQVLALLARQDKVWVGTLAGLERLDPATGGHDVVLRLDPELAAKAPWQALAAGPDGAIWYAAPSGLYRVGQRGGIERIGPAVAVRSLLFDHAGRLWVGSADGLYRLQDGGRGLVRVWPRPGDPSEGIADIRALAEAPDQHLWLSVAASGLRRYNPNTGAVQVIRETPWIPASLPEDSISALLLDRGGALWAGGLYRGPSVTDPLGTRFRFLFDPYPQGRHAGVVDNSIRSTFEDSRGDWWIGTDAGRLLRYRSQGYRFEDLSRALTPLFAATPSAPLLRVMAFAPAPGDSAWIATTRGLARLDLRTATATRSAFPRWGAPASAASLPMAMAASGLAPVAVG